MLKIQDLSVNKALDKKAMVDVSGGWSSLWSYGALDTITVSSGPSYQLGTTAYSSGNNIVFGYSYDTALLGHELTHVRQY